MSWPLVRLGDVCDIRLGKTPPRGVIAMWDADRIGDCVWCSIADMANADNGTLFDTKEYISQYAVDTCGIDVVKRGTLLLSFKLTLGRTVIAGRDLYTNEAIAALPIKDEYKGKVSLEYLSLYFSYFDWNLFAAKDEKVLGKTLNKKKLAVVPVVMPPLDEQKRIVEKLEKELKRVDEMKAKFERMEKAAEQYFKSALAEAFENVEGECVKLGDVCENCDSQRIPITKSNRRAGAFPYYGASGVVDYVEHYIFDGNFLLVSEDGANLLARSTPIAFSVSGKIWVNNHAHVLRFESMDTQRYVECFLAATDISDRVTGAAQPKLTQNALNEILLPCPSLDVQRKVVKTLDAAKSKSDRMVAVAIHGIEACTKMRKALLAEAFDDRVV